MTRKSTATSLQMEQHKSMNSIRPNSDKKRNFLQMEQHKSMSSIRPNSDPKNITFHMEQHKSIKRCSKEKMHIKTVIETYIYCIIPAVPK